MVYECLGRGRQSAKTGKALAKLLGLSLRELTETIEAERKQGIPICAATGTDPGYYLAANMKEMQDYCASLSRRLNAMEQTRTACEAAGKLLPDDDEN